MALWLFILAPILPLLWSVLYGSPAFWWIAIAICVVVIAALSPRPVKAFDDAASDEPQYRNGFSWAFWLGLYGAVVTPLSVAFAHPHSSIKDRTNWYFIFLNPAVGGSIGAVIGALIAMRHNARIRKREAVQPPGDPGLS